MARCEVKNPIRTQYNTITRRTSDFKKTTQIKFCETCVKNII